MPVSTSSSASRSSRKQGRGTKAPESSPLLVAGIVLLLTALSAAAIAFFYSNGYVLYYGDATAHVNIARRVFDSRTPGWGQIGTVWLPLPHLLMLPFVVSDRLWQTGLAGSIPVGACFVLSGVLFFLAARRVFRDQAAAVAAVLLLALNPNLLYLQSIPMTEVIFQACLAAMLYFSTKYAETQTRGALIGIAAATIATTLARYDGWVLIPLVTLFVLLATEERRWHTAVVFGAWASLGVVGWLVHNLFFFEDALAFYHGPGSALAINGGAYYPGKGNWAKAALYVREAIRLCAGPALVYIGAAGVAMALVRRALWPLVLLGAVPAFYVWSMHSGGTPIFVPHLWPVGAYYNTRYGTTALPFLAFAGAALVTAVPRRWRGAAVFVVVAAAVTPWLAYPRLDSVICWKESQVNSIARRAWTREAADYLRANYKRGDGILTSFGDIAGIYQQAGIPFRETLNDCNWPIWQRATEGTDPKVHEGWAVAISADTTAMTVQRSGRRGARYDLVKTIAEKGAPVIQIYRRQP